MSFLTSSLLFGLASAFLFGMSKTGVPGLSILGVLVMMMAFPGTEKLSSGAVLPLLVLGDLFAVRYYWRFADWRRIRQLLPAVGIGLFLGTLFMLAVDHHQFKISLALMILTLVSFEQLRRWRNWTGFSNARWFAWLMGTLAGFTTLACNAAGPVMTVYLAALNLKKHDFMGTLAVSFCIINLTKLPLMGGIVPGLKLITTETLGFNVLILPGLLLGVLLGRRLFGLIPERYFVPCIMILNMVVPIQIILF
jgi:uncharacterized membrane protein YfcA